VRTSPPAPVAACPRCRRSCRSTRCLRPGPTSQPWPQCRQRSPQPSPAQLSPSGKDRHFYPANGYDPSFDPPGKAYLRNLSRWKSAQSTRVENVHPLGWRSFGNIAVVHFGGVLRHVGDVDAPVQGASRATSRNPLMIVRPASGVARSATPCAPAQSSPGMS